MMGWNTSLTADDVHRRIPCDGVHWRRQEAVTTPYLGIWDKAAGRIGQPITLMPPPYQSPEAAHHESQSDSGSTPAESNINMSNSAVGAFAYGIEATESMSRVTTYFLQQKVNIHDRNEINSWLTRFKELDLRLVHWKMLLPQKWKSNLAQQTTRMDPNLTLAHVTHNTSLIMLHQLIAYPPLTWAFRKRLPSVCSQETCCSAAVEISYIVQNYLKHTPEPMPLHGQLAFCVYLAARVLLVHWRYDQQLGCGEDNELPVEFWSLVRCLEHMSVRWRGPLDTNESPNLDLAAKYALKMRQLHARCVEEQGFRLDVANYSAEVDHCSNMAHSDLAERADGTERVIHSSHHTGSEASVNDVAGGSMQHDAGWVSYGGDPFPSIHLDQQFADMDRIIAFDDGGMFTTGFDGDM
jgi:hypothetical protein